MANKILNQQERTSLDEGTLVLVAHPDLDESRVNAAWVEALKRDGRTTVRVLADEIGPDGFDVHSEQQQLKRHKRIILQFPFHWYGPPPLLNQWLDEVLERGWAYGPGGNALTGKFLSVAVTTWSRAHDYTYEGMYGVTLKELLAPFRATAIRVGMEPNGHYALHGVGDRDDMEILNTADDYARWASRPQQSLDNTDSSDLATANRVSSGI